MKTHCKLCIISKALHVGVNVLHGVNTPRSRYWCQRDHVDKLRRDTELKSQSKATYLIHAECNEALQVISSGVCEVQAQYVSAHTTSVENTQQITLTHIIHTTLRLGQGFSAS